MVAADRAARLQCAYLPRSFYSPNWENDTMNHFTMKSRATAKMLSTSLVAMGLSLSFAAATVYAQKAEPQPAPTATGDAAPTKTTWEDLDRDRDGNLSKDEAAAMSALHDVFDKADANADGRLTGDEYRVYLAANKGMNKGMNKDDQDGAGQEKKE
jgi:EF hand